MLDHLLAHAFVYDVMNKEVTDHLFDLAVVRVLLTFYRRSSSMLEQMRHLKSFLLVRSQSASESAGPSFWCSLLAAVTIGSDIHANLLVIVVDWFFPFVALSSCQLLFPQRWKLFRNRSECSDRIESGIGVESHCQSGSNLEGLFLFLLVLYSIVSSHPRN